MSLADYTAVKASLGDWLHRGDITSQCDDFIDLFESDFNATVRAREMEQVTTLTATDGYLLHPTNWLGWKEIRGTVGANKYELSPMSDESGVNLTGFQSASAYPVGYKVTGSKTYLYPLGSSGSFAVKYYEGVGLSSGTNWLLTRYPGAYLYGALLQATAYIVNDPRVPLWQSAYGQVIDKIKADSAKQSWSGQVLQMRPDRVA